MLMRNMTIALRLGLLALCLAAGVGRAQFVEDSMWTGRYVRDFVYNYRNGYVIGMTEGNNAIFSIWCGRNSLESSVYAPLPLYVTYNATNNRVYCTHGHGYEDDSVLVADAIQVHRIKEMPLPGAWRPIWDSVSNRVYVACGLENDVAVIDCRTDSVIDRIRVGETPSALDINTRHRKLYVRNWDGESVSIIDLNTNHVIRTIPVGGVPMAGLYHQGADKYYAGATGATSLVVIDGIGDTVLSRLPMPNTNLNAMAAAGPTGLLLVGLVVGEVDSVFAIDPANDSVVHRVAVGRQPEAIVWSSYTGHFYVACAVSDVVQVLSGDGSRVLATLEVGGYPKVLASAPEYHRVYVGHSDGSYVYVIKDSVTGIEEPLGPRAARRELQAWPNPFRNSVRFDAASGNGEPAFRVYALDGRLVARVEAGVTSSGLMAVWDGRSFDGADAPPGVYFVTAVSPPQQSLTVVKIE